MELQTVETQYGTWTAYGMDGRLTTGDAPEQGRSNYAAGVGWRAYDPKNPHGGDYGWGPLADTESGAINAMEDQNS